MDELVIIKREAGWARVTLNRPEKRNALSVELMNQLTAALQECDEDPEISAMLIDAAGQDFCTGYNLGGAGTAKKFGYENNQAKLGFDRNLMRLENTQSMLLPILRIHKPIVVRLHGRCFAGGTDLAFVCDMVIASTDAEIGYPATRDLGSPVLPMWLYHVGPQWAKRLLLTGDSISGSDAAQLGLVMKAVEPDKLDREVDGLMNRLGKLDGELLSAHKASVNYGLELMGAGQMVRSGALMDARAQFAPTPMKIKDMAPEDRVQFLKERRKDIFGSGLVKATEPDNYDDTGRIE